MHATAQAANLPDGNGVVVRMRSLLVALNHLKHPVVAPPSIDTSRWFLTGEIDFSGGNGANLTSQSEHQMDIGIEKIAEIDSCYML